MLAACEGKPERSEQRLALRACRLLHRPGPREPSPLVPGLWRKQRRGPPTKRAVGELRVDGLMNDPPPRFGVAEHGKIAAHRIPERFTAAHTHRFHPIRDTMSGP